LRTKLTTVSHFSEEKRNGCWQLILTFFFNSSCPLLFQCDYEVERGIFRRKAAQGRSEALFNFWVSKGPESFGIFSLRRLLRTISLFDAEKRNGS